MNSTLRFATFNVAMSSDISGHVFNQMKTSDVMRFKRIAAIIQHCDPDVLLLCEFDHLGHGGDDGMLDYYQRHFLEVSQYGLKPITFSYSLLPATNTGLPLFDTPQEVVKPENAQGFGSHHGQYGFVLLSKYPFDEANMRSWQTTLWHDYEGNKMPVDYYPKTELGVRRLSSKNHIVVPVIVGDKTISVVACHPTPPVFDGPERRNLKRNADEIRLLQDIINGDETLADDNGIAGGVADHDAFVVMGDLNADPVNGDGDKNAITDLLNSPRLQPVSAASKGALETLQRKAIRAKRKATHNRGLRLDYVLPSKTLKLHDAGVFWPEKTHVHAALIYDERGRASAVHSTDHRLVWADVSVL